MGATSWWYVVDYEEDVGAALARLKDSVLRNVEFFNVWNNDMWVPDDDETEQYVLEAAGEAGIPSEDLLRSVELLKAGRPPADAAHLLALNAEDGTHSILDMWFGIGEGFGHVTPLRTGEYVDLFGTETPSLAQVEAKRDKLTDHRQRWEGSYVVVYTDGAPSHLVFAGFSGD